MRRRKLSVRLAARWRRPDYFKDWFSPAVWTPVVPGLVVIAGQNAVTNTIKVIV